MHKGTSSYIPPFFFPLKRTPLTFGQSIRRRRVEDRLDNLILLSDEFSRLVEHILSLAYDSGLASDVKQEMTHRCRKTGIIEIDRKLDASMILMLSYKDYCSLSKLPWCQSTNMQEKLKLLLSPSRFLMFAQDTQGRVNGYMLLEYLHHMQLSLRVARFLLERITLDQDNETLSEKTYGRLITQAIETSILQLGLQNDGKFLQYYTLICIRMLLLPHGLRQVREHGLSIHQLMACSRFAEFFRLVDESLHGRYDQQLNRFHPTRIRSVHRQYLQLDRDGNGMISLDELQDYGKKSAFNPTGLEPTHDLTDAFVTQVFAEVRTFNAEMDYNTYLDFTLNMSDNISHNSLRFFWDVLEFQKQGFLDAFTIDFFLRSLLEKIHAHDGKDNVPTIDRLRTQIFDVVAPAQPAKITWQDLQRCKVGHDIVRLLTDYVAYRKYEVNGGRFVSSHTK